VSQVNDTGPKKAGGDWFNRVAEPPVPRSKWRTALRWIVLALVIVVFILIPSYIASQPSYLGRYPGMHNEFGSWTKSAHTRAACQSCHVRPGFLPQAVYRARLLGEFYVSLVVPGHQPKLFSAPTNEACQSCHLDLRTVSPSGDLNIPHRAHVQVLKMQCVRCHKYLVHAVSPEGTHKPTMATCLVCHNGRDAKNGCSTCHTNKDIPANHRQADWVVIHPQMVKTIDCQTCHKWTANWCSACHANRPKSHGANWRVVHGAAIAKHRNCEACHAADFCIRCHGAVPQLNFNPALKLVK
jgi:hypothetical protein